MQDLVEVLDEQRRALAQLQYRVTVLTLLLANDERQFLPAATDDVERASEALAALEERRTAVTARTAMRYGLALPVRLAVIADAAPAHLRGRLHELRDELRGQVAALEEALRLATDLAQAGAGELRAWLERLATGHADLLYGRDGAAARGAEPPASHVDERA